MKTAVQPANRFVVRRRLGLALLPMLLASVAQTACAQPSRAVPAVPAPVVTQVQGPVAWVRIINRESGRELPVYRYQGEYWIAGQPGARYGISIMARPDAAQNRMEPVWGRPRRIEAVVSVDGVNVITGQTASVRQTGYVLTEGQWYSINGWRKSDQEVAAFHFTSLPNAYASRTGRPDNVGVIGVALYSEKYERPIPIPRPQIGRGMNESAASSKSMQRAPAAEAAADASPMPYEGSRLGTGHGEREGSAVTHTTFERRSSRPEQIVIIRYDSYDNLVAMGIIPQYDGQAVVPPQPFPDTAPRRYVPDPPAW